MKEQTGSAQLDIGYSHGFWEPWEQRTEPIYRMVERFWDSAPHDSINSLVLCDFEKGLSSELGSTVSTWEDLSL